MKGEESRAPASDSAQQIYHKPSPVDSVYCAD